MSRRTALLTASVLTILSVYLGNWLLLANWFAASTSGGLVNILLCYWLAWAIVSAGMAILSWIVVLVLIMTSKGPKQETKDAR